MKIIDKVKIVFEIAVFSYKNPTIFTKSMFEALSKILELIMKVAEEQKPYMTSLCIANVNTGEKFEIVSIWAGAGIGAEPNKRIAELTDENCLLKQKLSEYIEKVKQNENISR